MNMKLVQGVIIALLSVTSLTCLIFGYLEVAVLFMTVLFAMTNSFRYRQMKAQGMHREAKWMFGMSVTFGVLFFVVLATILF
ncbi:hypothetical protein GPDM_14301 [Planococcus donghaensis MPA1U2]|uniref:Uncharacterized protein n=1 Tax=Planococcus donghaensis MPA1U2 TaxID=933115 RepID=E7RK40_9BACL|nr:hypothetical protein [Planococcus donghaensis]EGA88646.1 hypothetical protein GPDM_14301 [Planococcus donghaensis MPA1U2]